MLLRGPRCCQRSTRFWGLPDLVDCRRAFPDHGGFIEEAVLAILQDEAPVHDERIQISAMAQPDKSSHRISQRLQMGMSHVDDCEICRRTRSYTAKVWAGDRISSDMRH